MDLDLETVATEVGGTAVVVSVARVMKGKVVVAGRVVVGAWVATGVVAKEMG